MRWLLLKCFISRVFVIFFFSSSFYFLHSINTFGIYPSIQFKFYCITADATCDTIEYICNRFFIWDSWQNFYLQTLLGMCCCCVYLNWNVCWVVIVGVWFMCSRFSTILVALFNLSALLSLFIYDVFDIAFFCVKSFSCNFVVVVVIVVSRPLCTILFPICLESFSLFLNPYKHF